MIGDFVDFLLFVSHFVVVRVLEVLFAFVGVDGRRCLCKLREKKYIRTNSQRSYVHKAKESKDRAKKWQRELMANI